MIIDTLLLNGEKFALISLKMWKKIIKKHPEIIDITLNKTTQKAIEQAIKDRNNPNLERYTAHNALQKMQEIAH